jgi:biotin transport system substrate-specific component
MSAPQTQSSTLAGVLWPAGANALLRNAVLVAAGVGLMTLSAKVQVPIQPVPVTLQTLALPLIAAALGSRLGFVTMLAYIALGLAGQPVFANTPPQIPGPLYLFGGTGGFLVAYPFAAWIIGTVAERSGSRSLPKLFAGMVTADLLIFVCGFVWLAFFAQFADGAIGRGIGFTWDKAIVPFLLPDLVKLALAATLIVAGSALAARMRTEERS